MNSRMPFAVCLVLLVAALPGPPAVSAQTLAPRPVSVFVSANVGVVQPAVSSFTNSASQTDGINRDAVRGDYSFASKPGLDIGGGVILGPGLVLGVAVSNYSDKEPGSFTLTLEHPQFHPTLTATTLTVPLDHVEKAVHLEFGYAVPAIGKLNLMAFGGPSRFSVRQPLITDAYVDEVFNLGTRTWSAVTRDAVTETQKASEWGYHVGADLSYNLTNTIGVGTLIRYSRATVTLEDPLQALVQDSHVSQDLKVGGLQMSGGIRLRF